jgi:hypothetical protein
MRDRSGSAADGIASSAMNVAFAARGRAHCLIDGEIALGAAGYVSRGRVNQRVK